MIYDNKNVTTTSKDSSELLLRLRWLAILSAQRKSDLAVFAEFLQVKNRGIRDGVTMPRTTGLLIVFWKCVAPTEEAAWSRWHDEVHLLDLLGTPGGPCVATRWELAARLAPGMPGLGFTHVAVITSNPLRSLPFGR